MKSKLLAIAILAATFCSAPAFAGLNIIIAPVVPMPIYNQCEEQYNNIIQQEQTQLLMCQNMYDFIQQINACQENVINQTNRELYDNMSCRDYYINFGVIYIPGHEREHREWHHHPEHIPHHHDSDRHEHREYHR